ncbi:MAG TPA: hypothetical protein DCX03_08935 [Bacteroidales bacterium]|nr:hypothetical protein [Bacteroidales bacterium]
MKSSINWKQSIALTIPEIKEGVAEEIAVMLNEELEKDLPLVGLNEAATFLCLAENIFGY